MSETLIAQQNVITDLVLENKKLKLELEEAQNNLKKTITELDLAGIEIFKWERDFKVLVNDFKTFANRVKK